MNEHDLASLEPWAIYKASPDFLPSSPRRMLVTQAVEELARRARAARNAAGADIQPCTDIAWQQDLERTAAQVANMLRSRGMTSVARRVGGGTPIALGRVHWDHDRHFEVVATGVLLLEVTPGELSPHWVFVENDEVEMAASITEKVERPNSAYINPEFQWPMRMQELAGLLLSNVRAIVRREDVEQVEPAPGTFPGFPDIRQITALLAADRLSPIQRDALVSHAGAWLQQQFAQETGRRLPKRIYRTRAIAEFGEVVDGRVFDDVWKAATSNQPHRRGGGRIPGAPAPRRVPSSKRRD